MSVKPPAARKKKHILRKILLTLLVLLVLAGAALFAVDKLQQKYTVTYDAYTAARGTISNSLSFSGTLQLRSSAAYTANASTSVRSVFTKVGETVKKGDKLLRLLNGQTVEAEFDGRVNQMNVKEGDNVAAGDELVQVADFEHMKVSIRVDEYDINDVRVGDACRVTTTATEKTFDSVIADINYISSSSGQVAYYTATAFVDVKAEDGVYPGMQVTVTIPQEEATNVVVLKMDAISFDETNKAFVYTMNEAGELGKTYIETGVSNGNYVEIRSGLNENDTVYAVTETAAGSTVNGLLSGIFGGQWFNGGGRQNMTNRQNGQGVPRQNMQMPSGGFGGGGR